MGYRKITNKAGRQIGSARRVHRFGRDTWATYVRVGSAGNFEQIGYSSTFPEASATVNAYAFAQERDN